MAKYSEYVHFCCTSEDINNVAYALMMSEAIKKIDFKIREITGNLKKNVKKYSAKAMLSYTCLLYTSPSPRDVEESRMPSSA